MQPISARAVAFDKDGTLIDFQATWGPAMVLVLTELSRGNTRVLRAAADRLLVDLATSTIAWNSPIVAESTAEVAMRVAADFGRVDASELAQEMDLLTRRFATDSVVAVPVVAETLASVQGMGLTLGVVTNDAEATARAQLDRLGLTPFFASVMGYDSGHGAKPGPGMVVATGRMLGCPVESLVVVGDTSTDISAAVAAGARSVLIDPNQLYDTQADVVIDSLNDLPRVIRASIAP